MAAAAALADGWLVFDEEMVKMKVKTVVSKMVKTVISVDEEGRGWGSSSTKDEGFVLVSWLIKKGKILGFQFEEEDELCLVIFGC